MPWGAPLERSLGFLGRVALVLLNNSTGVGWWRRAGVHVKRSRGVREGVAGSTLGAVRSLRGGAERSRGRRVDAVRKVDQTWTWTWTWTWTSPEGGRRQR